MAKVSGKIRKGEKFVGMCIFQGQLIVASDKRIYRVEVLPDNKLKLRLIRLATK